MSDTPSIHRLHSLVLAYRNGFGKREIEKGIRQTQTVDTGHVHVMLNGDFHCSSVAFSDDVAGAGL